MQRIFFYSLLLLVNLKAFSQSNQDSLQTDPKLQVNAAQRLLSGNYGKAITVGGYGEILYNQPESSNGELDVQRLVLLFAYKFSDQVQFVTEIEFEHVQEVFIEQAFVNYNVADNFNIRGGLMLIPMGLINEFHEPTTFNGTERPLVDNIIVPTTWREIGIGITGRSAEMNLAYQAYVFNGFKSAIDDGNGGVQGVLRGVNGLRSGRQKGIQSTISNPNFAAKIDYYGIQGLRLGLSGYFGKTQVEESINNIDGTALGLAMLGLDFRYAYQRFSARGQYIYASLSKTERYNNLTGNDLGSGLKGWYIEGGYNLFSQDLNQKLIVFTRYEKADTHANTAGSLTKNKLYDRTDITTGLSYHIAPGVVIKGDYQFRDNALTGDSVKDRINFGIGVWF